MKPRAAIKAIGVCAECSTKIRFDVRPVLGEFVYCPECDTALEVVNESPLKLTWAYEDDLDDSNDSDDFDFDDLDNDDDDFGDPRYASDWD